MIKQNLTPSQSVAIIHSLKYRRS